MDITSQGQPRTKNRPPKQYYPPVSQREFCRMLEKRALAMSQKGGTLAALDSAFCVFLIDYLVNHEEKTTTTRFIARLTGIFARALEELAHPTTEAARRFIERYNAIGLQAYHSEWKFVRSLKLTHIDGLDYQMDFFHVVKSVSCFLIGEHEYQSVDFSVLESERKVLLLHFQRFLGNIWENASASFKELGYKNRSMSGIFGRTKFTTYHLDIYLVFEFSDQNDNFYSFKMAIPSDARTGYLAKITDCKVDLISALQMMQDVTDNFNLEDYRVVET